MCRTSRECCVEYARRDDVSQQFDFVSAPSVRKLLSFIKAVLSVTHYSALLFEAAEVVRGEMREEGGENGT